MATTPTKDYYALLGVKKTATADDIRKAFRKLARKHHPDVNPGDKKAEERFKEISEANDVLSDEKKRKVYDALGYYSDQIDPAAAEAAARGGYGGFPGGGQAGVQRGSPAGDEASPSTLGALTSPTTRPAMPANRRRSLRLKLGRLPGYFLQRLFPGTEAAGSAARNRSRIPGHGGFLDRDPRRGGAYPGSAAGSLPYLQRKAQPAAAVPARNVRAPARLPRWADE